MKNYSPAETPISEVPVRRDVRQDLSAESAANTVESNRSLQAQIDELRGAVSQIGRPSPDNSGIRVGSYRRPTRGMHDAPETQAEYMAEWLETHYGLQMDPGRRQVLLAELQAFLDGSYPVETGAEPLGDSGLEPHGWPESQSVTDGLRPVQLKDLGPHPGPLPAYPAYDENGLLVRQAPPETEFPKG